MFKANEIYLRNVMDVLKSTDNTLGEKVRPKYEDGTPSHTQFITNVVDTMIFQKENFQSQILDLLLGNLVLKKYYGCGKISRTILMF